MSETKTLRLSKIAKEFNLSLATIVDFLSAKGHKVENNPNTKIGDSEYSILLKEFAGEKTAKQAAQQVGQIIREKKESITLDETKSTLKKKEEFEEDIVIKDLSVSSTSRVLETLRVEQKQRIAEETEKSDKVKKQAEAEKQVEEEKIAAEEPKKEEKSIGVKVISRIDLSTLNSKTKPDRKSKKDKDAEEAAEKVKKEEAKKTTSRKKNTPSVETPAEIPDEEEPGSR